MWSLALLGAAQAQAATRLTFQDGQFILSGPGAPVVVQLEEAGSEVSVENGPTEGRATARGVTLVASARGLRIQTAEGSIQTTLAEIPVSGRIATKASNEALMKRVRAGERSLTVTGLSGVAVLGPDVAFVARWADRDGVTWLEALMKLDPREVRPKPVLVGRVEGTTTARGFVDSVVTVRAGRVAMPVNREDGLTLLEIAPDGTGIGVRLGPRAERALPSEDGSRVFTLQRTPHGTVMVGVATVPAEGSHRTVAEVRGAPLGFMAPSFFRYRRGTETVLVNLNTGAEAALPAASRQRATPLGLLSWQPASTPTTATLYDGSFRVLAKWTAPRSVPRPAPVAPRRAPE